MARKNRILIVDDDHDILMGVGLRLAVAGYDILTATDGQEAIQTAIQQCPDAIVLDIRMPKMDGMTALHHLQKSKTTKRIPIVMLSASLVDQQAALEAGARFFLTKPYQGKTLVAALDRVVRGKHSTEGDGR